MDNDSSYLGNSPGPDDRGRLHVKVANTQADGLPLPTGASTSDNQINGNQITKIKGATDGILIGNVSDRLKVDQSGAGNEIFGSNVSGRRYNQIEINFNAAPDANLITNTTTGGATVTQSNGHTLYSTGVAVSAQAKGISVQKNEYRAGNEIYCYFTAAFTTPTSANSYQRIGLFDANNGFFIGFNGLNFGVTKRTSAVDTFIIKSSWNGDPLDGTSSSKFTRNGAPEAINWQYSNIFRIRFAWLGSAPVLFEVFSPDGQWVVFQTFKIPNSQLDPSIAFPDLPMTVDVSKTTANSQSLIVATACWAAGCTSELSKITDVITDYTLAGLTRSVLTGRTTAGGSSYVNVKVSPSGAVQVGGTLDAVTAITNPLPAGSNLLGSIQIDGGTDGTNIGNIGDALKVSIASEIITAIVPTYTAAAVAIIAATNPTDIFILRGSATKVIKIIDVQFSALRQQTTYTIVQGVKRSTDNTGGTFTLPAIVSHESTQGPATALVRAYTANPTSLGTSLGPVYAFYSFIPNAGGSGGGNIAGIDVVHGIGKPIILRGTNELFAINLLGQATAGLEYTISISWIEDTV